MRVGLYNCFETPLRETEAINIKVALAWQTAGVNWQQTAPHFKQCLPDDRISSSISVLLCIGGRQIELFCVSAVSEPLSASQSVVLCFAVASRRLMPVAILYLQFRALSNIGNCFRHLFRIGLKTDVITDSYVG